jgi:dihydroorotate dehydrogenase (NAD+) catalytic subunit
MMKYDLTFDPPIMNAAGSLGFAPDSRAAIEWSGLGAFVTNPISISARTPSHGKRFLTFPGGFLFHTGYPNPGFSKVLRKYAGRWNRSSIGVIVHLLARSAEELEKMARHLESVEGVNGLEVGIDDQANASMVSEFTQAACGELPVIVRLPIGHSVELAASAMQAGALAISLAPPRGTMPVSDTEFVQGRLYGPAILPMALKIVHELSQLGLPVIGAGGIYSREHVNAMLSAGAMAVQLDSVLWRDSGRMIF